MAKKITIEDHIMIHIK